MLWTRRISSLCASRPSPCAWRPTAPTQPLRQLNSLTISAAPGLFVILWASGFIGAKLGLPYAEPLTFLFLRMFGAVLLLGAIILVRSPQVAETRRNSGQLRNRCVHARFVSWWRVHFDREWSSRCSIGAYCRTAALAHLDDSQSPARRAGGRTTVGWSSPRYCWRISRRSRQGDDRWGYVARVVSVVSSSAQHYLRHDLSKALRQRY